MVKRLIGESDTLRFTKWLVAALLVQGIEFLDMRHDIHHVSFSKVINEIKKDKRLREVFPLSAHPSTFTGRYAKFSRALFKMQTGWLSYFQCPSHMRISLNSAYAGNS